VATTDSATDAFPDADFEYPRVLANCVRETFAAAGVGSRRRGTLKGYASVVSWYTTRRSIISIGIGYPEPAQQVIEYEVLVVERPASPVARLRVGWPPTVDVTLESVVEAVERALHGSEQWLPPDWQSSRTARRSLLRRPKLSPPSPGMDRT